MKGSYIVYFYYFVHDIHCSWINLAVCAFHSYLLHFFRTITWELFRDMCFTPQKTCISQQFILDVLVYSMFLMCCVRLALNQLDQYSIKCYINHHWKRIVWLHWTCLACFIAILLLFNEGRKIVQLWELSRLNVLKHASQRKLNLKGILHS